MATAKHRVVLVSGGSGLVGYALKKNVAAEAKNDETWIFLPSINADHTLSILVFSCGGGWVVAITRTQCNKSS